VATIIASLLHCFIASLPRWRCAPSWFGWRRLLRQLFVLIKAGNVAKRAHCHFERVENGYATPRQHPAPLTHRGVADSEAQQRFVQPTFTLAIA
jgi:hypothetical protein